MDGLVQDCSISLANALELPQTYTKPSTWLYTMMDMGDKGFASNHDKSGQDTAFETYEIHHDISHTAQDSIKCLCASQGPDSI